MDDLPKAIICDLAHDWIQTPVEFKSHLKSHSVTFNHEPITRDHLYKVESTDKKNLMLSEQNTKIMV